MGLIPWRNKQEVPVRSIQQERSPMLAQFRVEVDRLFDNIFEDPWRALSKSSLGQTIASWIPSLNASEDEKQILVSLEAPGIDSKDIDISINGNTLTIKGEKKEEKEDKGKNYYLCERRFGSFQRSVALPANIDPDSISADYKNGVLRITADKTGELERKQIPVKTN